MGGRGRGRRRGRSVKVLESAHGDDANEAGGVEKGCEADDDDDGEGEDGGGSYFDAMGRGIASTKGRGLEDVDGGEEQEKVERLVFLEEDRLGSTGGTGAVELQEHYRRELFPSWERILQCGINLLIVGFGSKREILNSFARRLLHLDGDMESDDGNDNLRSPAVVVVHGFNPGATVKALLHELSLLVPSDRSGSLPSLTTISTNAEGYVLALEEALGTDVLILIHNVEGPGLRSIEAQRCLASLASSSSSWTGRKRIRVMASMDHVNAPLMWDSMLWHRFNFCVQTASTFESYALERKFSAAGALPFREQIIRACGGVETSRVERDEADQVRNGDDEEEDGVETDPAITQDRKIRGAMMLLKSLSANAKDVFRLLVESGAQGITEQNLLKIGREKFIVSNPTALRSMLTEMRTHDLISKTSSGGGNAGDKRGGERISLNLHPAQIRHLLRAINN